MIDLKGVTGVCPLHIIPNTCSMVQQASIIAKIFSGISSKTAIKCIISIPLVAAGITHLLPGVKVKFRFI